MHRTLPLAAVLLAAPAVAQDAPEPLYTRIRGPELVEIVRAKGFDPEVRQIGDGQPYMLFEANGYKVVVFTYACNGEGCGWLQLYAGFSTKQKPKAAALNAWNRDYHAGRGYMDASGDAVLESDLDVRGGVSRRAIEIWLEEFPSNVRTFAGLVVPSK